LPDLSQFEFQTFLDKLQGQGGVNLTVTAIAILDVIRSSGLTLTDSDLQSPEEVVPTVSSGMEKVLWMLP
jgi:hypothetical protein